MICTVQVSNNRQLNTLITVHRGIERDQKKERKKRKKSSHIVHTDKGITTKKFLLNIENLFEAPKKHFNLG